MKRFSNESIPMNLQLFAEPAGGTEGGTVPTQGGQVPAAAQPQTGRAAAPSVDYAKIQQMLDGTLAAKEDTALKAYFKQQGLSQEEMDQAIAAFKQQKQSQQPDVTALQAQAAQAQTTAQQARMENAAILAAVGMGLDAKTTPYVLKMADLGSVTGADGKINEEALKGALSKVLEDIPALKPQTAQAAGFVQVGASGAGRQPTSDDALKKAFGL